MEGLKRIETRRGFTLVESLFVLAIAGLVVSLLLPAIQSMRETSRMLDCRNRTRQLILASQMAHDAYGCLPPLSAKCSDSLLAGCLTPAVTRYGSHNYTFLVFLLPYMEQSALFDRLSPDSLTKIYAYEAVPAFVCPSDGSVSDGKFYSVSRQGLSHGVSCYAGNNYVFGDPGKQSPVGASRLPVSIPDGLSNTLFIAEKYGTCSNTGSSLTSSGPAGAVSGSLWGIANDIWRPGFNLGEKKQGKSLQSYPPAKMFQYRPQFLTECIGELLQTSHLQGIVAAFGDGSVRAISPNIDKITWAKLNDPRDGEVLPLLW